MKVVRLVLVVSKSSLLDRLVELEDYEQTKAIVISCLRLRWCILHRCPVS